MKFGMIGDFRRWQVLNDFGEFWPTFPGAQIFDRGYLGHFLSDCHKILHDYGSDQWTFLPRIW